jgi:hypothetical protein
VSLQQGLYQAIGHPKIGSPTALRRQFKNAHVPVTRNPFLRAALTPLRSSIRPRSALTVKADAIATFSPALIPFDSGPASKPPGDARNPTHAGGLVAQFRTAEGDLSAISSPSREEEQNQSN